MFACTHAVTSGAQTHIGSWRACAAALDVVESIVGKVSGSPVDFRTFSLCGLAML